MIGSSRRRSAVGRQAAGPTLELHLREARLARLHRRLLHASLAALAGAVVALFMPLGLPGRLWVVLAAAALGAAWPPRRGVQAVLASIRAQTGLSYETALGLQHRSPPASEAPATPADVSADPYGFEAAVVQRAALRIRGYESEPRPAWWLPALVLTAALLVLPDLVLPSALGGAGSPATPTAVGSGGGPEAQPAPEPAAPEPPDPGRAEPPGAAPNRNEDDGDTPVTDLPEGDVDGQAPLTRYLQSLRERPASSGGAADGAASDMDAPEAERRLGTDDRDAGERTGRREGDPSGNERTERSTDEGGGPDGGHESGGAEQAEDDGGAGGEDSADTEEDGAQQVVQPGGDQQQSGQSGGGSDEAGADSLQASGEGETGSDAEGAESAGGGGSDAAEEALDPEGASGMLERLQGVLQTGPESVAGSVRLPGSTDVELPAGTSYAPYQSAAEEAITEGDLPLDYLEIIRRYFR